MIGGDPTLAKEFTRMLVHHASEGSTAHTDKNGEINSSTIEISIVVPDKIFILGIHHKISCSAVEINVKDCMK